MTPTRLAQICWPTFQFGTSRARPTADGWLVAGKGITQNSEEIIWAALQFDGGVAQGTGAVDAGLGANLNIELVDGRFLLIANDTPRTQVLAMQVPGGEVEVLADLPYTRCWPTRGSPLMLACPSGTTSWLYPATPLRDTEPAFWVTLDGGVVHQGLGGVSPPWSGPGDLGTLAEPDAGPLLMNWVLATDAGRTTVEQNAAGVSAERRVYRLNERLVLLTWEPMSPIPYIACPACPIEGLFAEYVCLP